jgi:Domain of Unknown Function (DUF1080).
MTSTTRIFAWKLCDIILLACAGIALCSAAPGAEWEPLVNGKDLAGWDTFLRPANPNDTNYGLNRDPEKVFTVENQDGGPVIHISGKYWGGIITTQEFENYHLRLEYKWGKKTWPPRLNATLDSGLLYHCAAPSADAVYPWPRSIEFNITEHDTGEFWSVENTIADAEVVPIGNSREERASFKAWCERNEAQGPKVKFQKGGRKETFSDGGFMPGGDFEKRAGEWNILELYVLGDRSVHIVNGKVALVLTGLRQKTGGQEVPLTKGRIELQSESAEIFFRNVQVRSITEIPAEVLK